MAASPMLMMIPVVLPIVVHKEMSVFLEY
uniref:Uncharacterized protein n=1 Tax=Rhizophora mucronata TaxID=61149 RepID=A0A2P2IT94_RHIMU